MLTADDAGFADETKRIRVHPRSGLSSVWDRGEPPALYVARAARPAGQTALVHPMGMETRETTDRMIRASEIGQYLFCARAWWLGSVKGLPSAHQEEMEAGGRAHRRHGREVRAAVLLSRLAWVLLALALLVAVLALLGR